MKLKIAKELKELPTFDYRQINNLQGELKTLTANDEGKLLRSMTDHGFFVPIFIWFDKESKAHLIDGHQRVKTLTNAGCTTYDLPYVQITAKSRKDAAEKLLLVSSSYGKTTAEGWLLFADEFKISTNFVMEETTFDIFLPVESIESHVADKINQNVFDVDDGNPAQKEKSESRPPRATDDDYALFSLIMNVKLKDRLTRLLDEIRHDQGHEKLEQSLEYILDEYEQS